MNQATYIVFAIKDRPKEMQGNRFASLTQLSDTNQHCTELPSRWQLGDKSNDDRDSEGIVHCVADFR